MPCPSISVTRDLAAEHLQYDPATGLLTCIKRSSKHSGIKPGDILGWHDPNGYIVIGVFGQRYQAHRLAWLLQTGVWPEGEIDHINHDKHDNRWINLRDVSQAVNQQNQNPESQSRKKNGRLMGAYPSGSLTKPWKALIKRPDRPSSTYLGCFHTEELAHLAYVNAKRVHHEGCTL